MSRAAFMIGRNGRPFFKPLAADETLPPRMTAVERMPERFETRVDGAWVTDHRAKADFEAGAAHIAEAHLLKFLEAQDTLAGRHWPVSLLAPEAAEKGLTIEQLAEAVIAKRQMREFVAREVARQRGQAGHGKD